MDPENSRYDRSRVPETSWPDGSPVSNWSKAVEALTRAGNRARVEERNVPLRDDARLANAA